MKIARRLLSVAAMLLGAFIGALLILRVALVAPLALATAILIIVSGAAHRASQQDRATD